MATAFGKFQLQQRLALGGMGEVHLATCDGAGGLPTTLVVKRLLPHLERDKEFLDLFLDEARIAARLSHPNVARTWELGQAEGRWYLAIEFVDGHNLRELLDRARANKLVVPMPVAVHIAAQAAAGLAHAHQARDEQGRPLLVVHRDVSPHNLLLGFGGEVKLIDFGIARAARRSKAVEEEVLRGKYPYMSPEQVSGAEVDHRSDQFSLGVVLWELLCGRRLFQADAPAQAISQVQRCEVPPPSKFLGALPRGLEEAVMRALRKNPAERFPDTQAFAHALERVLAATTGARPQSDLARLLERLFPSEDEVTMPASAPRGAPTGPKRSLPPKHVVEAWERLLPAERSALFQLTVFPRQFSVEAAEAVVELSGEPGAPFVLDVLEGLKKAGLIDATSMLGPRAELAFVLPPAVKDFVCAQKAPSGLREAAARRLAKS